MATYELYLLGAPRLSVSGAEVRVSRRKAMALLAYLAVTGRAHTREALATVLWPESDSSTARGELRRRLSQVNQLLGGDGLNADRETVRLDPDLDLWLDVTAFHDLLGHAEGHDHPPTEACPACLPLLERAAELYTGGFMAGFSLEDSAAFDDWQFFEAEALRDEAASALVRLATYFTSQGDLDRAVDYARRWLAIDPLHEPAHRHLMVLYARANQRAAALRQFETCQRVLQEELGVEPSARTREVYDRLVSGETPLAPTAVEAILERELRTVGPCPYRGLAVFREEDAPFFHGREAFVERLADAVSTQPLVAMIVGASGSGKSSVIYAGLFPKLRQQGGWTIVDTRPGRDPFHALATALRPLVAPDVAGTDRLLHSEKLAHALRDGQLDLHRVAVEGLADQAGSRRLLLLVDQFEELFTLCPDPDVRRAFIDALLAAAEAASATSDFTLLITLRADFMGQALGHRPFADALQAASQLLGPMTRDELRGAIEKPADAQGAAFEAGLVDRLLDDVADEPGHLPLLEFALTLLWERLDFGWLTHAAYEQIGRVEGALARYAQQVYVGLSEEDQLLCRRAFTQLVQPGEGTEDTRRVASRAQVGKEGWHLVQHLANQRLVVTGRDELTGNETVEVVHEALIANWDQLQAWMAEDRAFRTWQERLRVALRTWEETEHDDGALLRGAPLAEAEGWLAERPAEISGLERSYIDAGTELRERREREREEQQQRDLAAAEQLAEERAVSATRLRRRAAFLALLLIAALAAAGVASVFGRRNADLAADNAQIAQDEAQARAAAEDESRARATAQAQEAAQRVIAENEAVARATAQAEEAAQREIAEREREEALRQAAIGIAAEADLQRQGPHPERAVLLALEAVEEYPYTWQAERALGSAVLNHRLLMELDQGSWVNMAEVSPDGTRILSTSETGYLRVWDLATGGELLTIPAHLDGGSDSMGRWSPSGDRILTSGMDEVQRIWDAQTGDLLVELIGHGGIFAAWSPDGSRVLTFYSTQEDAVTVWDTATGEAILSLPGELGIHKIATWSPDGRLIASRLGKVWDAVTGDELYTMAAYQDQITARTQLPVAWSPDGTMLSGTGLDGTARIWAAASGDELMALDTRHTGTGRHWWSPDSTRIVIQSNDGQARIWDVTAQEEVLRARSETTQNAWGDPWSPDGSWLILPNSGGHIRLWDVATGQILMDIAAHTDDVTALGWLPRGEAFFTGAGDGSTKIWRVETALQAVGCRPDCPSSMWGGYWSNAAWSQDGERIARTFADGTARVWDLSTGQDLHHFSMGRAAAAVAGGPAEEFSALWWSPDGSRLLATGMEGSVEVRDGQTGDILLTLAGHNDAVVDGRWSLDGTRIATASVDGRAIIWDASTGAALTETTDHNPFELAWSPDGTRVATTDLLSNGGPVHVWDAATGQTVMTLLPDDFGYGTGAVAWSPDGERIATFSEDGIGRVWDASSGDRITSFEAEPGNYLASWAPSGDRVMLSGWSNSVQVWDGTTGQQLVAYEVGVPSGAGWSPDGTMVAVSDFDGNLSVYPAWETLDDLIAYAKECCVLRELTPEERVQFGLPEN